MEAFEQIIADNFTQEEVDTASIRQVRAFADDFAQATWEGNLHARRYALSRAKELMGVSAL